jgi:hypothetical protein
MLHRDIFNVKNPADVRTIIAAVEPQRFRDDYTVIMLKVWYEELLHPVPTIATPFDCERHCKELWIRAMAGEYGLIEVLPYDLNGAIPSFLLDPVDPEKPATLLLYYPSDMSLSAPAPVKVISNDSHG